MTRKTTKRRVRSVPRVRRVSVLRRALEAGRSVGRGAGYAVLTVIIGIHTAWGAVLGLVDVAHMAAHAWRTRHDDDDAVKMPAPEPPLAPPRPTQRQLALVRPPKDGSP